MGDKTIMNVVLASGMTGDVSSVGGKEQKETSDPQVTDLAKRVDGASINEPVVKVGHEAVNELFKAGQVLESFTVKNLKPVL